MPTDYVYSDYVHIHFYRTNSVDNNYCSIYDKHTNQQNKGHKMPCDCPNCQKDNILNGTLTGKCVDCQKELTKDTPFQIINKTLVCAECASTKYILCANCGKHHRKDLSKKVKNFRGSSGEQQICQVCFSQYFRECNHCHGFFDRHDVFGHNDKIYCKTCFAEHFQVCSMCQNIHPIGTMTKTVRGKIACDNCFNAYGPIDRYETKPVMAFHGRPPHFYGVELEVELEDRCNEKRGAKAAEVVSLFSEQFVIVKDDGSLNTGFEIVTQPASLDEQRVRWGRFFDNRPVNLISHSSRNCGLHVHCSRRPLSLLTIAKIVVFVNNEPNKKFIETIAGRGSNNYSIIEKKKYSTVRAERNRNNRYEAVNLCNKDTIEFRIFKGTLKRESFFKALEFCDALIHFCNTGENSIAYCRDVNNFVNYVGLRSKDYPHLWAFICAKVLRKETKLTKQFGFTVSKPAETAVKDGEQAQPTLANRRSSDIIHPSEENDNQV